MDDDKNPVNQQQLPKNHQSATIIVVPIAVLWFLVMDTGVS